jgi:hypothetical protein
MVATAFPENATHTIDFIWVGCVESDCYCA